MMNGCYNLFKPQLSCLAEYIIEEIKNLNKYVRIISCWCLSRLIIFIFNENIEDNSETLIKESIIEIFKVLSDDEEEVINAATEVINSMIIVNKNKLIKYLPFIFYKLQELLKENKNSNRHKIIYNLIILFYKSFNKQINKNLHNNLNCSNNEDTQVLFDDVLQSINFDWDDMLDFVVFYFKDNIDLNIDLYSNKEINTSNNYVNMDESSFSIIEIPTSELINNLKTSTLIEEGNASDIKEMDEFNIFYKKTYVIIVITQLIKINSCYFSNKFSKYLYDVLLILGKIRIINTNNALYNENSLINFKNIKFNNNKEFLLKKVFYLLTLILKNFPENMEYAIKKTEFLNEVKFYSIFTSIKPYVIFMISELINYNHKEIDLNFNYVANLLIDSIDLNYNIQSEVSYNNVNNDSNIINNLIIDYNLESNKKNSTINLNKYSSNNKYAILKSKHFNMFVKDNNINKIINNDNSELHYSSLKSLNNIANNKNKFILNNSNCNNSLWALSILSLKYKEKIFFFINKIMKKLDNIINKHEIQLCIIQNYSILFGRLALGNSRAMSYFIKSHIKYICIGFHNTADSIEKRQALTGICLSIIYNPAELINNLTMFINTILQYNDAPFYLKNFFKTLTLNIQKYLREKWKNYFKILPTKLQNDFNTNFKL